jgi:flagellar hook-associated protein 1 FlgK
MPNLFAGINLSLQALLSQQTAVEIIEHNVANVNTPGYRRQEAVLKAGLAVSSPGATYNLGVGQMGTGVSVDRIKRFTLDFFDTRYRQEIEGSKQWEVQSNILQTLEASFAETSTDGVLPKLDAFWSGWQKLSVDPSNTSLRSEVLDNAKALASALNSRAQMVLNLQMEQDLVIDQRVEEINGAADQIARLNGEISRVISIGEQPNDLLDQRDILLDRLAEIAGATSSKQLNGEAVVAINGHVLVQGQTSFGLVTEMDPGNHNFVRIEWEDGQVLTPRTGELAGILDSRDNVMDDQMTGLNNLSQALISRVNELHLSGFAPGKVVKTSLIPATVTKLGSGSVAAGQTEITAGSYSVESRLNAGVWQFRVVDSTSTAVNIQLSDGSGFSDQWQDIPTSSGSTVPYDTGRGLTITFGGDQALYSLATAGAGAASLSFTPQQDFFTGTSAMTMHVNSALDDTSLIASGLTPNASGDGELARMIANIRGEPLLNNGTATANQYYTGKVSDLGLDVSRSKANAENRKLVSDAMNNQRLSVTGVSLNEEAANLVKAQKAYEAAARLMNAIDEMLDKIINGLGLVGR